MCAFSNNYSFIVLNIYFMCMGVLSEYKCTRYVLCTQRPEDGVESFGIRVIDAVD